MRIKVLKIKVKEEELRLALERQETSALHVVIKAIENGDRLPLSDCCGEDMYGGYCSLCQHRANEIETCDDVPY